MSITRLAIMAMILGLTLSSLFVKSTGALFSDTQSLGENTFSTGTLDISSTPASALFSLSGQAAGAKIVAPLTVTNNGSLQLRYAIKSTTTENILAGQIDLTIKTSVTSCTNSGFNKSGVKIYGTADLGNTAGLNIVGDPAQGGQAGDRILNASVSEVLCFQVELPAESGNTYQGRSTAVTLEFISEQIGNNP